MITIRDEIQNWLELVTRGVKGIPFNQEVDWGDIESVYNGSHCDTLTPTFTTSNGDEITFEEVYCDAISIDHMCSEILNSDFLVTIKLIERYRGVKLVSEKFGRLENN